MERRKGKGSEEREWRIRRESGYKVSVKRSVRMKWMKRNKRTKV